MNYNKQSDSELEVLLKNKVDNENKIKIEVLHLLAEVEHRRLYSKSYPSLFMYCVKVIKYSNGCAQRRIDAMRAMKLVPEIETKLQTGELNLTTVDLAQTFFGAEVKAGKSITAEIRRDIFKKLENKSTDEAIKELVTISPLSMPQEKRRLLSDTKTELKVTLESKTIEKLDKLKALLSHKHPHLKDSELMDIMAEICLEKLDPIRKIEKSNLKKDSVNISSKA